jgi:hypothetical protein
MLSWAIVVVLYLLGMGFFYLLGGLAGAADALEGWGRRSASAHSGRSPMRS